MICPSPWRLLTTLVLATTGVVSQAGAQVERVPRAYQGLFGGNEGAAAQGHTLDFTFSLAGGYDDNVTANEAGGSVDPRFQQSSSFVSGSAGLSYSYAMPRVSFDAGLAVGSRYYPDVDDVAPTNYGLAAGVSARPSQRLTLSARQSFSQTPYLQLGLVPPLFTPSLGEIVTSDPNYVVSDRDSLQSYSSVDASYKVSQRGTLTGYYQYWLTDFQDDDITSVGWHTAGFRYGHALTQHAGLRLGYGYRTSDYTSATLERAPDYHNLDVGIDYARALSFSRKTSFSFSTGSSAVREDVGANQQVTNYYFVGSANLNHEIGRSWTATASYQRDVRFLNGFTSPVFQQGVVGRVSGYTGHRTSMFFLASWSSGYVTNTFPRNDYDTYQAGAAVQYALSRYAALDVSYVYYRYDFRNDFGLPDGIRQDLDRNGIRAGLTVWLPLVR